MMFGSIESGKGAEVGEEDSQCGLIGAFERIEPFDEQPLGNARGPGLPRRETSRRKRIVEERDFRDAQGLAYVDPAPARDMESFGCRGKPVGALVDRVSLGRPFRESIACVDRALQSRIKGAERFAELRFERRDAVPAEHEFGGVVQEFAQGLA
jgi:hypothetical protein